MKEMLKDPSLQAVGAPAFKRCQRAYFAHSIIGQFDVSFMVQQHVVQLQVPVDNSLFVQEVQSDADFSCIKSEKEKC